MKRFLTIAIALVALMGFSTACSDDDIAALTLASISNGAISNGADAMSATNHWESVGTSSVALKIALYNDGTCELLVSTPIYDSTNLLREGSYDCTFVLTGLDSVDLTVDAEMGDLTVEIYDIEYDDETDTWTMSLDYEDAGGATLPADLTMSRNEDCSFTYTTITGLGCDFVLLDEDVYNAATLGAANTYWENVETSTFDLKLGIHEDDSFIFIPADIFADGTEVSAGTKYNGYANYPAFHDVDLPFTDNNSANTLEIRDIVYDTETDTWTADFFYTGIPGGVPVEMTMMLITGCNIDNAHTGTFGCD